MEKLLFIRYDFLFTNSQKTKASTSKAIENALQNPTKASILRIKRSSNEYRYSIPTDKEQEFKQNLEQFADEILEGKHGQGEELRNKLTAFVQNEIRKGQEIIRNEIYKGLGLDASQIEVFERLKPYKLLDFINELENTEVGQSNLLDELIAYKDKPDSSIGERLFEEISIKRPELFKVLHVLDQRGDLRDQGKFTPLKNKLDRVFNKWIKEHNKAKLNKLKVTQINAKQGNQANAPQAESSPNKRNTQSL